MIFVTVNGEIYRYFYLFFYDDAFDMRRREWIVSSSVVILSWEKGFYIRLKINQTLSDSSFWSQHEQSSNRKYAICNSTTVFSD